ncbi:MAG: PIG-L family deacetylase [Saprospiraceae bacterium]|nr:PIG-L family deacetylase [Saprospiraceae bacterium]MDW8484803.1 PIG-L family deacetylase [Saprospiraceae bacterium]
MRCLATSWRRWLVIAFVTASVLAHVSAQRPLKPNAADLHDAIKRLGVLGSVLYVAAHPDDENQRFISYCANEKRLHTTYLSLTRGDGGQNLIGAEFGEALGVLRTQELLMARAIDGGHQRFSRANDFGYSKTADETLRIWDKEAVLADIVQVIRETQPDIIVNRFSHDKNTRTHGHHTASAMLAIEAFHLANRPDTFTEQLKHLSPWQPRRLFFNTSWFFFGSREAFEKMDKSHLFSVNVGTYLPLKGKSNTEIAAEARSMHRCQGFGSLSTRGETLEYFDLIEGDRPKTNDLFEGINTTWTRLPSGAPIGELLAEIDRNFRSDYPAASVPDLLRVLQLIRALPDSHWKRIKEKETEAVIRDCLGLYLEASTRATGASPGDTVRLHLETIYRSTPASNFSVRLESIHIEPGLFDTTCSHTLALNRPWIFSKTVRLPESIPFTAPFWLRQPYTTGMYTVDSLLLRTQPETPRALRVRWHFSINGLPLEYQTEVASKTEEPALGEVWQPFEVLPPAFVEFTEPCYLIRKADPTRVPIALRVRAFRDSIYCRLRLLAPSAWKVTPSSQAPEAFLARKDQEWTYTFFLDASKGPELATLRAEVEVGGRSYADQLLTVRYDHIPPQYILLPAQARAVRLDLNTTARRIGYYMGAGDDGPAALRRMGCEVTLLEDKDIQPEILRKFDAIVLGIRAYNTREALKNHQALLFEYVQKGGTLVVQYNNSFDLVTSQVTPLPLRLSRTRVTDETAKMRILQPKHPALTVPNAIEPADFEGWVQERGLYFPDQWDSRFTPLLACNDPGEPSTEGALLVAPYGKGYVVYTGLAFFRQFPAGVPGAYRLFANLISLKQK